MSFTRIAATTALGVCAAVGLTPALATAAPAPAAKAKVWAGGTFTGGKALDVYASCAKPGTTRAVVAGPRGMKATLTPMADRRYLGGQVTVPAALKGSWIRLSARCADGSTASVVVRRAAVKPAPKPTKPANAPVKVWVEGRLRPGATLDVYAESGLDAKGNAVRSAVVVGPRGMKATLTPMADKGWLGGTITVPKNLKGSWIRLNMTTAAGAHASTIVRS